MKLFKKIPMIFEDKKYEIRILYDSTTINVVAFLNNHPANGYRHQVIIPKKCDIKRVLEKHSVNELVEISKSDISQKYWEKLAKVIEGNI
ncbi:MAG: hypothetical protein ISR95_07030 [Candidatus Marinimicrobia bacterium]|nr:hypothetical protein [Candidatus Neomarinimicrobiota bacterium]MBL7047362.1 hypothetical protein [Candidatus Neomarinimicrobiota bacterium]